MDKEPNKLRDPKHVKLLFQQSTTPFYKSAPIRVHVLIYHVPLVVFCKASADLYLVLLAWSDKYRSFLQAKEIENVSKNAQVLRIKRLRSLPPQ